MSTTSPISWRMPDGRPRGLVTGCCSAQEWLLPWWWEAYSKCNDYPVTFADFGMSSRALEWCRKRGEVCQIPEFSVTDREALSIEQSEFWNLRYSPRVWQKREKWFKKPFAILQSPYNQTLWCDIDCEVRGNLELLFERSRGDIALSNETPLFYKARPTPEGEVVYNSGVVVVKHGIDLIEEWARACLRLNHEFVGDQDVLSRILYLREKEAKLFPKRRVNLVRLPKECNWDHLYEERGDVLICHFHSDSGKAKISLK